jgi:small-conductance mechanosensitive channel
MPMYMLPGFARAASLRELITAGAFVVCAPLLGWIVQHAVIRKLKRRMTITRWGGDDIVIGAVRDVIIVWLFIAGAFGAVAALPLRPRLHHDLTKLIEAALILSATFVLARVAAQTIRLLSLRRSRTMRSSSIFVNLARLIIGMLGLLVLLQSLGVSVTPLLTALGVGGLAVALALQDTLSNFFSGLQIIATKKVKPGDFVRLDTGEEGYVEDIDWRHTSVRQLGNNMVLVPNAKLVNSVLTNFYYPQQELSVVTEMAVSYDSDLDHVELVTLDCARRVMASVESGVTDFEPFIRYHTFGDYSIQFNIVLRVREFTDQYALKHTFLKELKKAYERAGIVIPYPTLDFADGRATLGEQRRERKRA